MRRTTITLGTCVAVGFATWLGWTGGCQKKYEAPAPVLSTQPLLSLDDAVKLPSVPRKQPIRCSAISPDNTQFFVSLNDNKGTHTLGTVPLASRGKFERWATLKNCVRFFSVAWDPSGKETVAWVAQVKRGEPPVYETSVFTCTKGQKPVRRQVLLEERESIGGGLHSVTLTWLQADTVCVAGKDGIDLLELTSGKSRRLYEKDEASIQFRALRGSGQEAIEFILCPFETLTEPLKAAPAQLVRMSLDGTILSRTDMARGLCSVCVADTVYVLGGGDMMVEAPSELHSIRVFARGTNRLLYKFPLDWDAIVRSGQSVAVFPEALSHDGRLLICTCGGLDVEEEGFDTVLFKLAPP